MGFRRFRRNRLVYRRLASNSDSMFPVEQIGFRFNKPGHSRPRKIRIHTYCGVCADALLPLMLQGVGGTLSFFKKLPAPQFLRTLPLRFCLLKATTGLDQQSHMSSSSKLLPQVNLSATADLVNAHNELCSLSVQSTPDIEKKYVHRVYDAIAPHFSSTRFAKWPKVAGFLSSLVPGSVVLDAGCGNGKYLGFNDNCFYIGCDISAPLINICAERGHEVIVADAVNLPYRTDFGDAAISIAVLHHLSTENRRKKAIDELVRIVKKGGLVLITVWAVEQEDKSLLAKWTPLNNKYQEEWIGPTSPTIRNPSALTLESIPEAEENNYRDLNRLKQAHIQNQLKDNSELHTSVVDNRNGNIESHQEFFVPWHLPYHRAEISGASASALENGLAKKDDKKGAVVYNRYYHVFVEGELERLVSSVKNVVIREQFYDKSNWCVILEKT